MSTYTISLFLHIVGALGLFAVAVAAPAWSAGRRQARMAGSER